ncbi:MAG: hypothetical protein O3A00_00500 [Planctomycetota bacterium]|nr:hypothetical protein [Planctomycetota bacterium]
MSRDESSPESQAADRSRVNRREFDRFAVRMESLSAREHRKSIEPDHIPADTPAPPLSDSANRLIDQACERIRAARNDDRPVVAAFGAHAIKNGLGPVFLSLIERGWLTHLATNGAGVIHDWEFAFHGQSCEHVGPMVAQGRFGNWQETGYFINLAINVGAFEGKGYGESVGAMIEREGLEIPTSSELELVARAKVVDDPQQAAVAADLLHIVRTFELPSGWLDVKHPWKRYSIQAGAFRLDIPFTSHPMIGHDIIYNHPMNHFASLGRAAGRDFLMYAESVSRIDGGVYLSIGSAVMSPMIFEKSLSMAQNVALQRGEHIEKHYILVNDLAESTWDWSRGEPPEDNPAYYLRFNKSFSRMGGTLRYLQADNRDFLLNLSARLQRGPATASGVRNP